MWPMSLLPALNVTYNDRGDWQLEAEADGLEHGLAGLRKRSRLPDKASVVGGDRMLPLPLRQEINTIRRGDIRTDSL